MKKYLPFSRRQPSLDRFAVSRSGWSASDRFNGKSMRRTSAATLNTRSIQVVRGAYNIDLNKVDSSFTKLHRACLLNDDALARKHIQKVDNNLHDSSHRYPIHLATVNGNLAILKLLIENGANPNVQDNEGNTPLIKSIECGHEHLVKYFLNNGADPNRSDMDDNTAIHWAVTTESIIAVEALLNSKKCDLSLKNNKDETCLHLAVRSPLINTSIFETMLKNGAELAAKDQLGLTAVDIAQACNNRLALNAFNKFKNIEVQTNTDVKHEPEVLDTILNEDYKAKYLSKNRENLEYEKKLIQMTTQMERLELDMDDLKSDHQRLKLENSKLKIENAKLTEQINKSKKRYDSVGRTPSSSSSERTSETQDAGNALPVALTSEHPDETVECRSHKEFLVARRMNQERINKLKNSLAT